MVINESFAKRFWPKGDAVGRLVQDGADHTTVVGVVRDVAQSIGESPGPQFYRPFGQKPITTLTFVVRTGSGDPVRITPDIRRIVHDLDPSLPIYSETTARRMVDFSFAGNRSFESLMIVFGVIALVLATMGVYAVTSFLVAQRTQELGLRIALGAQPGQLLALVLRGSAVLAVVGAVVGLGGAFLAAHSLSHTLYGVGTDEIGIYVVAAGLLVFGTLAASVGPARRAAGADPMTTLRTD